MKLAIALALLCAASARAGGQEPVPASEPSAELVAKITLVPPPGMKTTPAGTVVWLPGLDKGTPAQANATVASKNKRFEPHVVAVRKGGSVAFPNVDPIYHNAFSVSATNPFDLGLYRKGASRSATLKAPGLVRVYCNIHPEMAAYVMVVEGGFFAVADEAGEVRFTGIPPGRHVVRLWNEMAGEQEATLDFGAGRATAWNVSLDASQYRRLPHKNKHGKDYPPATKDADRY
jgi:plastocyanin